MSTPAYKKIYSDIIAMKYPNKEECCRTILNKQTLGTRDVIKLNKLIFDNEEEEIVIFNQKLKSYDVNSIFEILEYQKRYHLTNVSLARHFNLSRNTLTAWKKRYFSKK